MIKYDTNSIHAMVSGSILKQGLAFGYIKIVYDTRIYTIPLTGVFWYGAF
jgi:hypothetical protein